MAAPNAPTSVIAYPQAPTSIIVEWDGASGATGYRIERSPTGTSWVNVSGDLPQNPTDFEDNGLHPGTKYFYRVFAFNADGQSVASAVVSTFTDPADNNRLGGAGATRRHPAMANGGR